MKVVSYNTLADKWTIYRGDDPSTHKLRYRYEYVAQDILDWNNRLPRLVDKIRSYDPDIICLQEVELGKIAFLDYFSEYDCNHHVISKKRTNDIGNITFWKRDKLTCLFKSFNSCAIFTKFDNFTLINVHLKAGFYSEEANKTRHNQIKSCLKNSNNDKIIICGDFNEELNDSLTSKELMSNNFIIPVSQITCNVYAWEKREHHYYAFDHVVYKNLDIKVEPCPEPQPLPSIEQPSDHFPLIFTIS